MSPSSKKEHVETTCGVDTHCLACDGTGVSYWSDGIWGACLLCSDVDTKLTPEQRQYAADREDLER